MRLSGRQLRDRLDAARRALPPELGIADRLGRSRRSPLALWFTEIDRVLVLLVLALVVMGLFAVGAASPASARRLSEEHDRLPDLYFFTRQAGWLVIGLLVMFLVSLVPRDQVRRASVILCAGLIGALFLVLVAGIEKNGSHRWLWTGFQWQPSEFLKPAYAVTMAWILSLKARDPDLPAIAMTGAVTMLVGALLMLQPNLGDTIVFFGIWAVLVLLSGISLQLVGGGIVLGLAGMCAAYLLYPVATARIDGWLAGSGEFDQVALAWRTLTAGGAIGAGPWLGTRKFTLPEAHTDYIFSVVGEEFGLLACIAIALTYLAVVARVLSRLMEEDDLFTVLAASGLVAQLGGQALINMAVNLQMFPSKGMTLPFISYGGSSLIALCAAVGALLSITRRNPFLPRAGRSPGWSRS